jgi:hypothetical protein
MTRHHNEMVWKSSGEPELIVTVGVVGLMMIRNEFQKPEKTRAKGPVNLDRWTAEGGCPQVPQRVCSIFRAGSPRTLRKSSRISICQLSKKSMKAWMPALGSGMAGTASSGPRAGRVEARLGPMMTDGRESEASIFLNRALFSSVLSTKAMPMPRWG